MAGELQSPLDDLNRRIQMDPKVVTNEQVKDAFSKTVQLIQELCNNKKISEAQRDEHIKNMEGLRDQMIQELEDLRSSNKMMRNEAMRGAQLDLAILQAEVSGKDSRHAERVRSYAAAEGKAGQINDYEGVDALHNKTRDMFQGYLAAMEGYDGAQAQQALEKAKAKFQKSWYQDNVLNHDEMMDVTNMRAYESEIAGLPLTDEGKGLILGFMAVADNNFKNDKDKQAYKDYLKKKLNELNAAKKLDPEAYLEKNKREEQRKILEDIMSPKEWQAAQEKVNELRVKGLFRNLRESADKIVKNLNLKKSGDKMWAFLERNYEDIKVSDEAEIEASSKKLSEEASKQMSRELDNAKNGIQTLKNKLEKLKVKNANNQVKPADFEEAYKGLHDSEAALATIAVVQGAVLDAVVYQSGKLRGAADIFQRTQQKIDAIDKSLATVIATPNVPGTGGGGAGTPGKGPETGGGTKPGPGDLETPPRKPPEKSEWKDKWAKGETVDSTYKSDLLKIATGNAEINAFDDDGNAAGKIPGGTEVKRVDKKAKRLDDGSVFVKVRYENKNVWVDESKLIVAEPVEEKKTPPEPTKPELNTFDPDVKKIVGTEYPIPDYMAGLNSVALYIREPEKFRDGITFNLPFNNSQIGCSLRYESGTNGKVNFVANINPKLEVTYATPQEFMKALNNGDVIGMMVRKVLENKDNYSAYSGLVGKTDFVDKGEYHEQGKTWPLHIEFDWEGSLDDPDVYIKPLKYGVIEYAIQWQHVGYDGKNWRKGYATSIEDFFNKMKHYRDWGNRYGDIEDEKMASAKAKEVSYENISNPYTFNPAGGRIGNVVKFTVETGYASHAVLDWGGGNDADSPLNARLNMWVGDDGKIRFNVENTGLNANDAAGTAKNGADVVAQVEKIRMKAGRGGGAGGKEEVTGDIVRGTPF